MDQNKLFNYLTCRSTWIYLLCLFKTIFCQGVPVQWGWFEWGSDLRPFTSVPQIVSYQSLGLYFVIFRKIYDHTENPSIVYKYRPFTSLLPVHTTIFHTCNDFQLQVHSKDTYAINPRYISRTKVILQRYKQVLILYLPSGLFCNVWLVFCCCLLECQSVFRESATTEGINFNSRYSFWVPPIRRWMSFNDRSFLAGIFTYNKVMLIWLSRYLSYIERER